MTPSCGNGFRMLVVQVLAVVLTSSACAVFAAIVPTDALQRYLGAPSLYDHFSFGELILATAAACLVISSVIGVCAGIVIRLTIPLEERRQWQGRPESRVIGVDSPPGVAFDACVRLLEGLQGIRLVSHDDAKGHILARSGVPWMGWSIRLVLEVEAADDATARVRVSARPGCYRRLLDSGASRELVEKVEAFLR